MTSLSDDRTTTPSAETRAANPAQLLKQPNIQRWILGQGASLLGDQVFYVAIGWAAVRVAEPDVAGLIIALAAVPRTVFILVGGVVADRLGALRVLIGSDLARLVVMLLAAAYLLVAQPSIAVLLTVGLTFGVIEAAFHPAVGALPPRLADREQLTALQGLRALVNRGAAVIGAPLGGFVLATGGLALAFAVNAATFAISLATLATMRLRPLPEQPEAPAEADPSKGRQLLADLRAGLRYIRRAPALLPVLFIALASEFGFTGAFNVGLPLLADQRGWGPGGLGLLIGAFGLGSAAASLTAALRRPTQRPGRALAAGALLQAGCLAALPWLPTALVGTPATFLVGAATGQMLIVIYALIQTVSDTAMLGRVISFLGFVTLGAAPLAYAITGLITDHINLTAALTVSAFLASVAGVIAYTHPDLRHTDTGA
ncbi:MFS transporter [Micromonospora sp. DR5-3]|uniref:MFS transporter n=1 Tax=unclassified Micromonospora TaxID=2617518 RepID=UPI0011D89B0A|nr:MULTISPECIES: MFS transporter [unclassified Micromonospora]MCW3817920.1 MFS transporter [Micromonospora sp. DR5-3]TYC19253.1 MFS transporter [Micromonospora sp. MP36]